MKDEINMNWFAVDAGLLRIDSIAFEVADVLVTERS